MGLPRVIAWRYFHEAIIGIFRQTRNSRRISVALPVTVSCSAASAALKYLHLIAARQIRDLS